LDNIQQMTERLNSKDNSLGLLLNDRALYDNLNVTTQNASNLLLDLKEHPKRYIHISVF
jgi:phospholipid/cholesterol/gamma-HCH transport system substrate-binding protein